ncbi:YfbU family protein [bacterium]|nr:YfbU family protein [bacterium]
MDLTIQQRVIIANQLRILEKLYPDEAEYYANHRVALERGFKLHYSWLAEFLDQDEMSEEESREVLNILEMYRAITFSYRKLQGQTSILEDSIRFPGFDGNTEGRQFSYVNYFIFDLGRYPELLADTGYSDFNSHSPKLDVYREKMSIWNTFTDKYNLSEDQIRRLLDA